MKLMQVGHIRCILPIIRTKPYIHNDIRIDFSKKNTYQFEVINFKGFFLVRNSFELINYLFNIRFSAHWHACNFKEANWNVFQFNWELDYCCFTTDWEMEMISVRRLCVNSIWLFLLLMFCYCYSMVRFDRFSLMVIQINWLVAAFQNTIIMMKSLLLSMMKTVYASMRWY